MLANRKPPAKPSPPASYASRSKATATPFVVDWDDDDDFQSPPHASRARPLKPCSGNGAASRRPGKKLKSSSSSGKENRPISGDTVPAKKVGASAPVPEVAETLAVGSRVSGGVPEAEVLMGVEICGLLKSGSDGFKLGRNGKKVVDVYGDCKGGSSSFPNSVDSRVMVRGAACDLGDGHCEEAQAVRARHCSSVLEEHAVTEMGNPESDPPTIEKELSGSDAREEADSSMLIRPMLLESDAKCECRLAGSNDSKGLHSGILSSVIDEWNLNREDSLVSDCGYGLHNSNDHLDSLEPKLSCPKLNYDAGGGDCHEAQKLGTGACNLVSQESEVTTATPENETTEDKSSGPEASNGHCCSNSSESKIVDSHMILDFEGDGYGDFEIGTQLNELINLCIEGCVEGHPECRVSPIEDTFVSNRSESDIQVQCPLCGSDISDLSEEFRQQHTNNCIDEDEPAKECYSNHEREPDTGENVENSRVLEWLRKLGLSLSKYEEIFVREEVDWETLQWLTEVFSVVIFR